MWSHHKLNVIKWANEYIQGVWYKRSAYMNVINIWIYLHVWLLLPSNKLRSNFYCSQKYPIQNAIPSHCITVYFTYTQMAMFFILLFLALSHRFVVAYVRTVLSFFGHASMRNNWTVSRWNQSTYLTKKCQINWKFNRFAIDMNIRVINSIQI